MRHRFVKRVLLTSGRLTTLPGVGHRDASFSTSQMKGNEAGSAIRIRILDRENETVSRRDDGTTHIVTARYQPGRVDDRLPIRAMRRPDRRQYLSLKAIPSVMRVATPTIR